MKRGTHPVAQLPARSPRPALRVVRRNHRLPQLPLGIAVDRLQCHRAQIRKPAAKRKVGVGFDGRTLATPPAERRPRRRQREPELVRQNRQSLARGRKTVLAPIAGPVLKRAEIAGKRTASAALLQDRLAQPLDRVGVKLVKANLHGTTCSPHHSLSQLWTGVRLRVGQHLGGMGEHLLRGHGGASRPNEPCRHGVTSRHSPPVAVCTVLPSRGGMERTSQLIRDFHSCGDSPHARPVRP